MAVEKPRGFFCYLSMAAVALAAPPIIIATIATFYFADAERARLEAIVDQTNADVTRTIEANISGAVAMLQALSTSPHLKSGDLSAFNEQARIVADLQKVTITLSDRGRRQFVNTVAPIGADLPSSSDLGTVDFGPDGRHPYVSGLFKGSVSGRNVMRVIIPIYQDGNIVYHLSGTIDPATLSRTLQESLETGPYFATVLDRDGVIIGRSIAPEKYVGQPLRALADAAAQGKRGVWKGLNPQGVPIFVYWRRSAESGWIIATGITQSALRQPLISSLLIMAHVAVVFIVIAWSIAGWIGRKMVRAHEQLVDLAGKLNAAEVLKAPVTPLREANLVGSAIEAASRRLNEQSVQILRAQETLERRIEQRTRDLAHKTALLETTLENMDQGLVAVNDDGAATVCNQTAWRLLDGDRRVPRELENANKLLARLKRVRSTRLRSRIGGARIRHSFECEDPRGVCLEVRVTPVPHGGMIYTLADVTQSRRHSQELQAAKECAEKASRAKTELLTTMSHEIRTPLNSVLGSADLLAEEQEISPEQRRLVNRIIKAGTALTSMMEDVLDLANIEAGRFHIRPRGFSLAELVDDIEALTSTASEAKGLAFNISIDPALPGHFEGDDSRIRQVLLNYVNNAVKFSFTGQVALAVSGSRLESGHWAMRFAVTDTGIGISAEKQKHLFRQFTQADPSIGRRFGGTGLGLSICKRLVEAMGGEVGVESELGVGSTLWFTLVLPEMAESALSAPPSSLPGSSAQARILVVEDMPINQDVARELIESLGHSATVVSSGEEAVAAVQKEPFDLVLMDIFMSGLDGVDATQAIRKLDHPARTIPIVACTANALPTQISQYKRAGLDGFVAKPLRRDELRMVVERFALPPAEHDVGAALPSPRAEREIYTAEKLLKLLGPTKTLTAVNNFEASLGKLLAPPEAVASDLEALSRNAHSLVSIASLFGMSSLSRECRKLETSCATQIGAKKCLSKMRSIVQTAQVSLLQLKTDLHTIG